jgi:hypothetical protein
LQHNRTYLSGVQGSDDEIDAARVQIEYGKVSVAPKVVTTILEGLAAVGVTPAKPAAFLVKKVFEQRETGDRAWGIHGRCP